MPRLIVVVLAGILTVLAGCTSTRPPAADAGFAFALIGDVPYAERDLVRFDRLTDAVNADASLAWILHAGDIKTGGTPCSDAYLAGRLFLLQRFTLPLILTPGDNEWTDCHRPTAGGFLPLERLAALRAMFFSEPGMSLGARRMAVTTQATEPAFVEFPENVRWVREGIVFAAMHVVGSLNASAPFEGRTADDDREAERRMAAAIVWLRAAFEQARAIDSPGVFLMIHANPGFENRARTPYARFLDVLEEETIAFGKPVILAHGDSHYFRVDKPLMQTGRPRRVANFTRVETFGASDVHWLRIRVVPDDPAVFFVEPHLIPVTP